jgi:L-histidine N-alpha-methyltransferase
MNINKTPFSSNPRIAFSNFLRLSDPKETVRKIIEDLLTIPRTISSIFLYDSVGSMLFRQITRLPEYYLSQIESGLIREFAQSSKDFLHDLDIIELGSGDCSKISIILDAVDVKNLHSICYLPVDISPLSLKESAEELVVNYPGIRVHCIAADFSGDFFSLPHNRRRLFCFFGSTIGNFNSMERVELLRSVSSQMDCGDLFVLGVDMIKEINVLEKAYNDRNNITASFNRNILNVVNSIIGSNFNPLLFEHHAHFNRDLCCIEMYLKAQKEMTVSIPCIGSQILIEQMETIHTESSFKFTLELITHDIEAAGLRIDKHRTDSSNWFSLFQLTKEVS